MGIRGTEYQEKRVSGYQGVGILQGIFRISDFRFQVSDLGRRLPRCLTGT